MINIPHQMIRLSLIPIVCLVLIGCQSRSNTTPEPANYPKTMVHYMGWYGSDQSGADSLRHWVHGTANKPLLGRYDSHDRAIILCHMLWFWSAGIDAVVVNVKDEYDRQTLLHVNDIISHLTKLSEGKFDLKIAISFDDQGFDLELPLDTALYKVEQFQKNLVEGNDSYLRYKGKPVIYSFDYPHKFLTAETLRATLDDVFGDRGALLVWNTFGEGENTEDYVDAFYPWVQPGGSWDADGLNWGKGYLDYFYRTANEFENSSQKFIGGGVWPGFDDRNNTSWGGNRLISRQDGTVYDSTWSFVREYSDSLTMEYVMIETWNDWNEGTEIEPSEEYGYKYIVRTEENIAKLTQESFTSDTSKYELALMLTQSTHVIDSITMDKALKQYIDGDFDRLRKLL